MLVFLDRLRDIDEESLNRTINEWIEPDFWFHETCRPIEVMDRLLRQIAQETCRDINHRLQTPVKD